jgi:hypothetical protein
MLISPRVISRPTSVRAVLAKPNTVQEEVDLDDEDERFTIAQVFERIEDDAEDEDDGASAVQDPLERARKIFVRPVNNGTVDTTDDGFRALQQKSVPMSVYQAVVREKYLAILHVSGVEVKSSGSIDGKDVLWQLGLDRNGLAIRHLAQRYCYTMPFAESAYADYEDDAEGAAKRDDAGGIVPAYSQYSGEFSNELSEFRRIDEIRILTRRIAEWVSCKEMIKQGVAKKEFLIKTKKERQELDDATAKLMSFHALLSSDHQ